MKYITNLKHLKACHELTGWFCEANLKDLRTLILNNIYQKIELFLSLNIDSLITYNDHSTNTQIGIGNINIDDKRNSIELVNIIFREILNLRQKYLNEFKNIIINDNDIQFEKLQIIPMFKRERKVRIRGSKRIAITDEIKSNNDLLNKKINNISVNNINNTTDLLEQMNQSIEAFDVFNDDNDNDNDMNDDSDDDSEYFD